MERTFTVAAALTVAALTAACGGTGNPVQPSLLRPATSSGDPAIATTPVQSDGARPPGAGSRDLGPLRPASCSVVTNGADVLIDGDTQGDGTLLAASVSRVPAGTQPAPQSGVAVGPGGSGLPAGGSFAAGDALGVVANLRGSCPNLTFTVQGRTVVTNSATTFYGLADRAP